MNDFSWSNHDAIVVAPVAAIAVYINLDGDVIIRQQVGLGDEDSFIIIPPSNLKALIVALRKLALK